MPGYFAAVDGFRNGRVPLQPLAPITPSAQRISDRRSLQPAQHLLPAKPDSIPVDAIEGSRLSVQPKLAIGSAASPLETEADRMAAQVLSSGPGSGFGVGPGSQPASAALHRRAFAGSGSQTAAQTQAPAIVHDAPGSPGQPLDSATRASLEPRFGANLGGVRLHTGADSAAAARSINAAAYTVGQDIFFAAGQYNPHSGEGRRLLAHELSHTIQQSGGGAGNRLSSTARGVYRDPPASGASKPTDTESRKPAAEQITLPVPAEMLPHFQLTPPSLLVPGQSHSLYSPPDYTHPFSAGAGSAGSLGHPGSSLLQPPSQLSLANPSGLPAPSQYTPSPPSPFLTPGQTPGWLAPVPGAGTSPGVAPKAPDRLPFKSFENFSIGARFGFPDLSKELQAGEAPSALQASIAKAEILNFMFTGQPPSAYGLDAGKLISTSWSLFATHIAPDFARKLSSRLSSKPAGSGLSYTLDATILFKAPSGSGATATPLGAGGGATLTIVFP